MLIALTILVIEAVMGVESFIAHSYCWRPSASVMILQAGSGGDPKKDKSQREETDGVVGVVGGVVVVVGGVVVVVVGGVVVVVEGGIVVVVGGGVVVVVVGGFVVVVGVSCVFIKENSPKMQRSKGRNFFIRFLLEVFLF